jgi:hypothetical protein
VHTVPEHGPRAETRDAVRSGPQYRVGMAEDVEIRHRISELVDLERSLREQLSGGEISADDEHARLRRVETELDQCWDLLRQRQALREFGDDPGRAQARSEGTVEGYLG